MKGIGKIILAIVAVVIAAALVGAAYALTGGFSSDVKTFMLIKDGEYILTDTRDILICETETFTVYHYDDDKDISAKLKPIKVEGDYTFTIGDYEYSWNADVVRYASEEISSYFTIDINQKTNEVVVSGTLSNALSQYASSLGGELTHMGTLPTSDMFSLEIKSGKSTLSVGCNFQAKIQGITLQQNTVVFGG